MGSSCCKKSNKTYPTPPNGPDPYRPILCERFDDSNRAKPSTNNGNLYPIPMSGDDTWVSVTHGGPFPKDAVRAMDREFNNSDPTMKNCYVAVWFNNFGEAIFGRACNNNGKVEAWFPWEELDRPSSTEATPFSILTYPDPATQMFRYSWIPIAQLTSVVCTTVRQGAYSPGVIRDLDLDAIAGELLGTVNLNDRVARIGHSGKVYLITENQFENGYVLCRVPNYGLPRELMVGDDTWISVRHGGPFPKGAVRAMDRELNNSDQQAKNCYVAVWTQRDSGSPVFGRALNKNGKIEAVFPTGIKDHHSSSINGTFSILTYYGPPKQNFCYAWIPIQQMNLVACQPVQQQDFISVVIPDLKLGPFRGELLGHGHLDRGTASVSYAGKVYCCTEKQYQNGYALCRVPNFRAIKPVGVFGDEERVSGSASPGSSFFSRKKNS